MIFHKKFILILSVVLIVLVSTGVYIYFTLANRYRDALSEKNNLVMEVNQLKVDISQNSLKLEESSKEYKKELDSLKQQLNDKQKELDNAPKLNQLYVNLYKKKNLSDPVKEITEDLMKRKDLIPEKAVLGGVMKIENVALLSPDYAYATFSDGHILGHMILKFYISKEGNIDWQLLHHNTY